MRTQTKRLVEAQIRAFPSLFHMLGTIGLSERNDGKKGFKTLLKSKLRSERKGY